MSTTSQSNPILVLGMHRSGTSFLVRALNLSGLWVGRDAELSSVEGRAQAGNPKGNYENREVNVINNAILARSGGAWFNPPSYVQSSEADAPRMRGLCAALEAGRPASFARWGWKDPRTLLTLDLWLRAIGRPAFVVASFRHPASCARSLLARDQIPMEVGSALWGHYNSRLLVALARLPHVLVRFDVPKEELLAQTVRVCEATGLRSDFQVIESWHDPGLVRSGHGDDDAAHSDPRLASIWNRLIAAHRASSCGIGSRTGE